MTVYRYSNSGDIEAVEEDTVVYESPYEAQTAAKVEAYLLYANPQCLNEGVR
jgi:hypothetical protein